MYLHLKTPNVRSGSRFGSAISNVGDLHKDGFEDFVVGAPYAGQDHQGEIYVYRGSGSLNDLTKGNAYRVNASFRLVDSSYLTMISEIPQRLTPEEFGKGPASGFGYAFNIEKGVDIDENGFNDFAVGAPYDDKAIILKSRKVFPFKLRSEFPSDTLTQTLDPKTKGKLETYNIYHVHFK